MDEDHRLALKLAQEAETSIGYPSDDQVIKRATKYLNFLRDAPTDEPVRTGASSDAEHQGF